MVVHYTGNPLRPSVSKQAVMRLVSLLVVLVTSNLSAQAESPWRTVRAALTQEQWIDVSFWVECENVGSQQLVVERQRWLVDLRIDGIVQPSGALVGNGVSSVPEARGPNPPADFKVGPGEVWRRLVSLSPFGAANRKPQLIPPPPPEFRIARRLQRFVQLPAGPHKVSFSCGDGKWTEDLEVGWPPE